MAKKTKYWFTKVTPEEKTSALEMVEATGADSESAYIRLAVKEQVKRDRRKAKTELPCTNYLHNQNTVI